MINKYYFIAGFLIILLFVVKRNERLIIGWMGEKFVSNKFKGLDPAQYKVLNDLLLPSRGSSATTQLDHVIVSDFGIFCIETKAYKGWIFGDANQTHWTQVIYRSKKKFYNPLHQNYAHMKAVEELVMPKFPKVKIFSFVVFPYADKLKISGTDTVGYTRDIIAKIKNITNPLLADSERDKIVDIMLNANITDQKSRREHVNAVKNIKK